MSFLTPFFSIVYTLRWRAFIRPTSSLRAGSGWQSSTFLTNQSTPAIFFKYFGGFVIHLEDDAVRVTDGDRTGEFFDP